MRMTILSTLATLALLTQPVIAPAQETTGQSMTAPGKAAFSQTVKETTTVVGIDPATRTITLKGPKGVSNLVAGEEVRNFDQLKVGDKVVAEYKQALSLDLKKGGGGIAGQTERESGERAPLGAKPGGSAAREVTIVANVVAVDTKKQLVTLRGPKGNTVDLNVQDPDQLKNIKKGDQVQAVYTEAVAVSVEPTSKK
ncbi:hypothetical protein QO239_18715 [Cupriavidus taiwanensis]|uniref:hypothetical protein n=1 Tax=Cupriavidus taiwanensis TaxID=164546 RepID=UPI00253F8489|nr:hypothetical protein [Cupriavidus taiwanensis]MDK3024630.1 hypothetical protein [Cupriavidus taiwanensis]